MTGKKISFVGLVGGHGTSLLPLTTYLQKEMYPILDKPFLEYTMENVRQFTDRLILVVGSHSEQVQEYFGSKWKNLNIEYQITPNPKSIADAISTVFKEFDMETAIVWFGDTYIPKELFTKFAKSPHENLMAYKKVDFAPKTPLEIDSVGLIVRVGDCSSYYADIGLYKLNKFIVDYLQKGNKLRFIIQGAIDAGHRFHGVETDLWLHLGTFDGGSIRSNPLGHRRCFKAIVDHFMGEQK